MVMRSDEADAEIDIVLAFAIFNNGEKKFKLYVRA